MKVTIIIENEQVTVIEEPVGLDVPVLGKPRGIDKSCAICGKSGFNKRTHGVH